MIRYKENGTAEKQAKMYQLRIYVEGGNYVVKSASMGTVNHCKLSRCVSETGKATKINVRKTGQQLIL